MKKTISIIIAFFLSAPLWSETYFQTGEHRPGSSVPFFADNVNLRTGPSTKNDSLGLISAGTKATIISASDETLTVNGYTERWYKVKTKVAEKDAEGFVWGGMLAKGYIVKDFDGDKKMEIAAAGILRADEEFTKWGEVRLIKEGRIIDRAVMPFKALIENPETQSSYTNDLQTFLFPQKLGALTMFRFESMYPACDYPNYAEIFGTDGSKIYFAGEIITSSGDAGGMCAEYVLPSQPGGKKDSLSVTEKTFSRDDDGNPVFSKEISKTYFIFNGKEFKKEQAENK